MKPGANTRYRGNEQGLVSVIILALILLLGITIEANMRVLSTLKGEIRLIDDGRAISEPVEAEDGA